MSFCPHISRLFSMPLSTTWGKLAVILYEPAVAINCGIVQYKYEWYLLIMGLFIFNFNKGKSI